MRKSIAGLLVTLLALMSGTVYAGERAGAFTVAPLIGGYTFDGVERLETRPVFGVVLGYDFTKNFALELTGNYVATRGRVLPTIVDVVNYRLEAVYNFMPESTIVPYLAAGGGGQTLMLPRRDRTYPAAAAGAGVKFFFNDNVALRLDGHANFVVNNDSVLSEARQDYVVNYEYTAGLHVVFGGVKPPVPAPVPPPAPTSKLSIDRSSVMKGETATLSWMSGDATKCEIQPGIGPVPPQGSAKITPEANTSYTLICSGAGGTTTSKADVAVAPPQAPTASMSATPSSIAQGETASLEWKSQYATTCEIQPGIGPVDPQGTAKVKPEVTTTYTLTCSNAGGKATSKVDVAIGPPPCPVVLTPEQEETVNLLIEFDFDKAEIKPEYHRNLDALGDFMKKYPSCEVTIEGHTDNKGTKAYNQQLSERRADEVKKYLVDKFGIDPMMIKTIGYGETKPIDTNKTEEGRHKNRRIQAHHRAVK